MGLLKLLALPVLGPLQGLKWIAEKVAEQADRELYDEDAVRGQLMELESRCELEEMGEAEYLAVEEALLARLEAIQERQAAERAA